MDFKLSALNVKHHIVCIALTLVAAAIGIALEYVEFAVLSIAFFAIVYIYCGMTYFLASAAIMVGVSYALFGTLAMYDALYVLLLAFLSAFALLRRYPYRSVLTGLAIGIALNIFIRGILPALLAGEPAFSQLQQYLESLAVISGLSPAQAVSAELYLAYSIFLGLMFAGVSVVLIYKLTKKVKSVKNPSETALKPMAEFHMWMLSKNFSIGIIVWACASFIIAATEMNNSDAMLMAITVAMGTPLCVQGISFIWFMGKTGCMMVYSKWVLIITLILLYPASVFMLVITGLIDQFTHMRGRAGFIKRPPLI